MSKHMFPLFPRVRQGFSMDINQQERCQFTGLDRSDHWWPGVITGDWSNNWVWDQEQS